MTSFRAVHALALLLSFLALHSPSAFAYLLPNAYHPHRSFNNDAFEAYNAQFPSRFPDSEAFQPYKYFSEYFGSAHVAGGTAPDAGYVCSLAYITMDIGSLALSGSGVLISNYKILTAAHNFDRGAKKADVKVYLGDRRGGSSTALKIKNIYRLSGYTGAARGGHDLAIIDLEDRQSDRCIIYWQDRASVKPSNGDVVTFLGYGRSTSSSTDTKGEGTLRQASLRIAENGGTVSKLPVCATQSATSQVVCAVSPGYPTANSAGTCLSDSGGPLIKNQGTINWVVGVNSYSDTDCDALGNVDMFARVYPHHAAIKRITHEGSTTGWKRLA